MVIKILYHPVETGVRLQGLNVTVDAIVNDASAALMAGAYLASDIKAALILGTGVNAAIELPVNAIAPEKFCSRPPSWYAQAMNVLVNTEMSCYGEDVISATPWDDQLNNAHPQPNMQPLEYFVGGRYLSEIVRLVIIDTVQSTGLLGGLVPRTLVTPYSLETKSVAEIER